MLTVLVIASLVVLVVLSGVPIAYGLSLLCFGLTVFIVGTERLGLLGSVAYGDVASFTLIAVPLFILTAELMARARISDQAFDVFARRLRRIPASLAAASNILSTIFAAIVGSSAGNTAIMGLVALRPMLQRGYDSRLACGVIVAGGALGVLIPPSTLFILYGVITEVSVGRLLIGGLIPGLLMSAAMLTYIVLLGKFRPDLAGGADAPSKEAATDRPRAVLSDERGSVQLRARLTTAGSLRKDLRTVGPVIALLAFMTWSIYAGFATPSEIAGLGAAAAIFLLLFYRRFTVNGFVGALLATARVTAMILLIVVMASYLGRLFAFMGIGTKLVDGVEGLGWSPLAVVFLVCGLLFVLGAILDSAAIILVVGPLAHTLMVSLGVDPIWWGIIFVICMEIALITPPFGINLFVLKSIAPDIPMGTIMRGALPFVAIQTVVLVICILRPDLVLWLPNSMS